MENSITLSEAIWSQFGASLDMLKNAITMCPEEHWDTTLNFWYTAFHCVFWTDYYLTTPPNPFEPPKPFTLSEFDPTGKKPERTYTKTEVLTYLEHCRQKARQVISEMNAETLNLRWKNDYKDFTMLEILFYNVRNVQHHTAQLNLLLRQTINNAPNWVSQAKKMNSNKI